MKTNHSGVSARNIHINQLANLAKSNFLSKLFYLFFMLVGVQLAYANNQAAFTFLYTTGITSMGFTYNHSSSTAYTVTTSPESSQFVVNVQAKNFNGSSAQANEFNNTYGSNKMGLATNNANADATDILITGPLVINGNPIVGNDFAFAHEHKSHDWWIATNSGNKPTNTQFSVHDSLGNSYCLSQVGTNFQLRVDQGDCSSTYSSYIFNFSKGKDVFDIKFKSLESPESGQINAIKILESGGVEITARPLNSQDIANSFNSLLLQNSSCSIAADDTASHFEVYAYGMTCGDNPQRLDFYVAGNLIINNMPVIDSNDESRVFILAHGDDNRWWLGTSGANGYFTHYGNGGMTNTNHVTVITAYGTHYILSSTSQNSFNIKQQDNIWTP